jgi:chorismate dehydratase
MRIGAVNYLNSKPLVYGLETSAPRHRLLYDLPSRLSDSLTARRLDVALVPSIEWLRQPSHTLVSDACVACRGPVLSVKLYFRVPPSAVRTLALDEGSRTSAALAKILLDELAGALPDCEQLPIGCGLQDTSSDAVLLIGDRAIQTTEESVWEVWDLGQRWYEWTGKPFVFATWIARPGVDTTEVEPLLGAARDRGVANLAEIAATEASDLGISVDVAMRYLRDNLHFTLGAEEFDGLRQFTRLCVRRGLVPTDGLCVLENLPTHGCTNRQ